MLSAVWRPVWFPVVGAIAVVMGVSAFASAAEARHRHHFGHYSSRQHHREVERGARQTRALLPVSRASNDARSRSGAGGFAEGVRRMIGACTDQVAEMKGMPFDAVSRAVRAGENQRNALEQIRSIVGTAADTLSVACPKDIPAPLSERLDTLGVALDAIAASLATLRPAFATFYETLDDEQKARLAMIDLSRRSQSGGDRGARVAANALDLGGSPDAEQDPGLPSMGRDLAQLAGQQARSQHVAVG